jgi:hypothetical protein
MRTSSMAKHDASDNTKSSYRYLHLMPDELAHLSPAELLQACVESRSLLQIVIVILSTPDASPTKRVVGCDLVYSQAMLIMKEPSTDQPEEVVADIKTVSDRLALRPSALCTAYEALAERGAVRINERILPKPRHQLSLLLDQDSSTDTRRK